MNSKLNNNETEVKLPPDLRKALGENPTVEAKWRDLTSIARRDFISWIETAKLTETRKRRIERACDMLAKGKRRPCCYSVVPMNLYKAFNTDAKAKAGWRVLTPDARRDFADWIESAKQTDERELRIKKTCEMLAQGKPLP